MVQALPSDPAVSCQSSVAASLRGLVWFSGTCECDILYFPEPLLCLLMWLSIKSQKRTQGTCGQDMCLVFKVRSDLMYREHFHLYLPYSFKTPLRKERLLKSTIIAYLRDSVVASCFLIHKTKRRPGMKQQICSPKQIKSESPLLFYYSFFKLRWLFVHTIRTQPLKPLQRTERVAHWRRGKCWH